MITRGSPVRVSFIVLVAAFLPVMATAVEEPAAGRGVEALLTIDIGSPIEGRLESTDARLSGKGPYRTFRFIPAKSGDVTIRMHSQDLDAYILVRDGGGTTLAEDDNRGPGDGAQAVFVIEAGKPYDVLAAGRLAHGEGKFRLEVLEGKPESTTYGDELVRDLAWYTEVAKSEVSTARRGEVLQRAGRCHLDLDEPIAAREVLETALEIARTTTNRRSEARILKDIGWAHFYLGERVEALKLFEAALEICRETNDRGGEAFAMESIAQGYCGLGQIQKGIEHFEKAVEIMREMGDRWGESQTIRNLGSAYAKVGQVKKAIECYEKALSIHRAMRDKREEGVVLGNLGLAYIDEGSPEKALETLELALQLHKQTKNRRSEGIVLGNLAMLHENLGQPEEAIRYYEGALEIHRQVKDREGEGIVWGNLAGSYLSVGRLEKTIECLEKALHIHRENKDPRAEGNVLGNLGHAYGHLGQWQKAIESCQKALQISRDFDDPRGEAWVLGRLGRFHLCLGKAEQATEYCEKALDIRRRIGEPQGEGLALADMSWAYFRLGQASRAIEYNTKALELFRAIKDRRLEGQALEDLGVVLASLGRGEEAIEHYERALEIHRETRNLMREAFVLWGLAKVYTERLSDSLALDACRRAYSIEMRILRGVERGLETSALQSRGSEVVQGGVAMYFWVLVTLIRNAGSKEEREALLNEALGLVEGLRARTLVGSLRTGDFLGLLSPEGTETWRRLGGLRQKNADLVRSTFEGLPEEPEQRKKALAELGKECQAREDEIAALERRLKTGEPKYANLLAGERELTREEFAGLLAQDEVLLHFNVIGEKVGVFIGRRDGGFDLQVLDADAEDLRAKIDALLADMKPRGDKVTTIAELKGRLGGLRAELLRGLEDKLQGARSILVVPDGFLHLFPFEALVLEDGSYLVESFGVRYAPSLGVLLELRRRQETAANAKLVLLGDPDFGKSPPDEEGPAIALSIRGGGSFRRLEHAREEIDRIAGLFEEKLVLRGKDATESRFKEESPRATLFHVATHGRYEQVGEGNAMFYSGLALAGVNGGGDGKEDGFLTALEVMALDLRAVDLAVLSACETAAGALQAQEGKFGLERAFFVAGVKAFIGSLWRVDDGATAEFMGRFYRHLLEGKPRAEALRLTKVDFIRGNRAPLAAAGTRGQRGIGLAQKAAGDWSHPYYWAPFVLSGDARGLRASSVERVPEAQRPGPRKNAR